MKRNEFIAASKSFLATAVLVAVFFMIAFSSADAAVVGKFTLVEGTVDLLKGGNLPAVPAKIDLSVEEKDVIRTKSASRAEITMVDKTVLRVAQRSRIDISEYSATDSSKKSVIKLDRGKVEATVEKKPVTRINVGANANTFEIHTPNAVAGVRGTRFYVSFLKNVSTTLVKEGDVCVYNLSQPKEEVCIPPSFITSITGSLQPEKPKPATKSEINGFEKDLYGAFGSKGVTPSAGLVIPPVVAVPAIDIIPPPISNSDQYPFQAEGYFSGSESSSPDITGTGTVKVSSNETAAFTVSGSFNQSAENNTWGATLYSEPDTTGPIFEVDLAGTQWSGNALAGTAAGYWMNMSPATPETGIYIGETSGTYNPSTWQATGNGSWIETNRFLELASTEAGRASLAAINVPAVEVGRVDLSGSIMMDGATTGVDFVSLEMNNVTFFAPSTGGRPSLWATNGVTGSYDFANGSALSASSILSSDNVITMEDGNTISAQFQFTQWQSGKWNGKLSNGYGDLSGGGGSYTGSINGMKGGAAGTMTGTTTGTLTGTASGTVK